MSQPVQRSDLPNVPAEMVAVLGSTFQRLLAEATFADAWIPAALPVREGDASQALHVELAVLDPWRGRLFLSGDLETVLDLAAGFHSLPDGMVDRGIALDFLAEIGALLLRDLFCASDAPLKLGDPREIDSAEAAAIWSSASAKVELGCNQGRLRAALRGP